ncbi:MAG: methionyl-tRNA formyltransferase [Candidatus Dojkabacteria bacterium]
MNKIKTVFFGTSDFGIPVLNFLIENDKIDLVGVVTQPDRPAGRKQELKSSAVKQFLMLEEKSSPIPTFLKEGMANKVSQFHQIRIEQPEKISKEHEIITRILKPDLIIVASYGQLIPNVILDFPRYKCLNIHASILPHLRGAVPIPMTILEGLKETGVTLQVMAERMDEGDIIAIEKFPVSDDETGESLKNKASFAAVDLLRKNLFKWVNGEIEATPQDHSLATYCYIADLKKEKAEIKFGTPVSLAERMVRAFIPWPVAWFIIPNGKYKGKRVKVFSAELVKSEESENNEMALELNDNNLVLKLKDGDLILKELQLEGKTRGRAEQYFWLVQ